MNRKLWIRVGVLLLIVLLLWWLYVTILVEEDEGLAWGNNGLISVILRNIS